MKSLSIKIDDQLLALIDSKARELETTRMEVIRSALVNFLVNYEDIQDNIYIESRKDEPEVPVEDLF